MKVILQKPVEKLGDPGDVVDVAAGYARNYLVPRGLAVRAEKGALKHAENLKRAHASRQSKEKVEFEARRRHADRVQGLHPGAGG